MSFEDKKKIWNKYDYQNYFYEGAYIDAQDTTNSFCFARITAVSGNQLQVNYDGWSRKWDMWFKFRSPKIASFRSQHSGYSGQNKVAIRNDWDFKLDTLREMRAEVENRIKSNLEGQLAHDTTQWYRGTLYVYVDSLLGNSFDDQDVLGEVNDFLKAVIRLIVTWIKKLGTMQKEFKENKEIDDLFLVCPRQAIIQCYPEFSDTLKRLFVGCNRAYKYYVLYDQNQLSREEIRTEVEVNNHSIVPNTFGEVVKDFQNKDFMANRIVDENEYNPDQAKKNVVWQQNLEFGQLCNFTQFFAEVGGFDAVINALKIGTDVPAGTKEADRPEKLPLEIVGSLTLPFKNLLQVVTPDFAKHFTGSIKQLILNRFQNLSDKELKEVDKDHVTKVLNSLKSFMSLGLPKSETAEIVEQTQLYIALRFLKSTNLEKRLKGLQDIRHMIERVIQNYKESVRTRSGHNYSGYDDNVRASEFMDCNSMKDWLIDNKVLATILGGDAHIEIVKRSGPILKFLCKYGEGKFDADTVGLIWKCQLGKHEEMVRTVYTLIEEIIPNLPLELIDAFYDKIKELPVQSYDEMFINFLKTFTREALEKRLAFEVQEFSKQQELEGEDDAQNSWPKFEMQLSTKEKLLLNDLQSQVQKSQVVDQDENFYGMPLLWKIIAEDSKVSADISALALESFLEMFTQSFRGLVRMPYLLKSLQNVLNSKNVVQSLQVASAIIKSLRHDHDNERFTQLRYQQDGDEEQLIEQVKKDVPEVVSQLQAQLSIVDCLINNIKTYHAQVKQKLKDLVDKNKMPDSVEDFVFVGKYSNSDTLTHILEFIEYVIVNSQTQYADRVALGINNINTLWTLFVNEPNLVSDQNLFLNWVNKQRVLNSGQSQYAHQQQMVEVYIFTEEEKRHFFQSILCDPQQVDTSKITLSQVKCFEKYFKLINREKQALLTYGKMMRVNSFEDIEGLDALWDIATSSTVEKAREVSQELLVDLHLKIDFQKQDFGAILNSFVQKCMMELQGTDNEQKKLGLVSLISLFLDRYEGIKPLKPELASLVQRIPGLKPVQIQVVNAMDPDNRVWADIPLPYSQTLGYFRQKIAEQFNLQINQFILVVKNQVVDPDSDDDRYYRDIQGHFTKCYIKKNSQYNIDLHPKFLISNKDEYFDTIFSLLSTGGPAILDSVWDLISKLPVSDHVKNDLTEMTKIKQAKTPEEREQAWTELFDPHSTFKLLYCLKIIQTQFLNKETQPEESKDKSVVSSIYLWKQTFVQLGGFQHLLKVFKDLNITEVKSMLNLKCIQSLIASIFQIYKLQQGQESELLAEVAESNKEMLVQLVAKNINFIDLICNFSLDEEQRRGESYDEIQKRLELAKLKKNRYKMLMTGNKADTKQKSNNDDDQDDSEDKKRQTQLMLNFREQAELLYNLFDFLEILLEKQPLNAQALFEYPRLREMIVNGMLKSENLMLRNQMCNKFKSICLNFSKQARQQPHLSQLFRQYLAKIIFDQLEHVLPLTSQAELEPRCGDFYNNIAQTLGAVKLEDIQAQEPQIVNLIQKLSGLIQSRQIVEANTQDEDLLLQGYFQVLTKLLQKFPALKLQTGSEGLLAHLTHECLFEIPTGNKGGIGSKSAPKCKSSNTRSHAFGLVAVLCRDCIPNLDYMLNYLKTFNKQPTWRTNKESDWGIKLQDDEKSSTGHVGIKNLGCICYMNSLNQQLFMIPGFRNDVLSIQDPNHDNNPDEDNMFLQWQTLFAGLLLSEKMYVNPKAYCHSFKDWDGNPVNVIEQMDVEEYLGIFLDKLENSIKKTPQEKTIHYHFGGMYANEIICKSCPHSYNRPEQFLYYGVPVKNKKNIYEGLQANIQGDMLEDQNQYMCEKCDKKVDALKRTCIKQLPRYLIMTLKRFEFDFDRMERMKVNDYFEFPEKLDMYHYTQEYLNKKESWEKNVQEQKEKGIEVETEEFDPELHAKSKYPKEYFQFELVGIVVHSGTAESGHYYSYIKEQQVFDKVNKDEQEDTWYEFNDIWVREFDKSEIPEECFGGEESSYAASWNNQQNTKFMKMRNAYLLVYKRLLEEDPYEEEEESTEANKDMKEDKVQPFKLGQMTLNLDKKSTIYQKIAAENHKYWQNRFLFGREYGEFVRQIGLYWNTTKIIPAISSCRNNDYHLMNPEITKIATENGHLELSKKPMQVTAINDVQIDLQQTVDPKQLGQTQLEVFKLLASFYMTILQRASDKMNLPDFTRYLKAYMNHDIHCAQWFLTEFSNAEIVKECFLENSMKVMRQILAGLVYCGMLKVYEVEKDQLDSYWQDVQSGKKPRQTSLGTMILTLLTMMPTVKNYSGNQSQYFHLIARFASLGPEARLFLQKANALERCLNYFYWDASPYHDAYTNEKPLPFETKQQPDIGLPTPEDPNVKKSPYALMKEQSRLKRLQTDEPKYIYLIETIGYLAACLQNQTSYSGEEQEVQQLTSPYALENSGFTLSQHNQVLFLPLPEFIQKLFAAALKPRAQNQLIQGYMHVCYHDPIQAQKLYETVKGGLMEQDYDKVRPFLVLFQHMLAAQDQPVFADKTDEWLTDFIGQVIPNNQQYFQWMEQIFDFIFKVGYRIPAVQTWLAQNTEHWAYLFEWNKNAKDAPSAYMQSGYGNSGLKLSKSRYQSKQHSGRHDKQLNMALYYYRMAQLNILKQEGQVPDLSSEVDLDTLDFSDYKWIEKTFLDFQEDRFSFNLIKSKVVNALDELVSINFDNKESNQNYVWESTHKSRLFTKDLFQTTRKYAEIKRLVELLRQQLVKEQNERRTQQNQWSSNIGQGSQGARNPRWGGNNMDIDDDDDEVPYQDVDGVDEDENHGYTNPYERAQGGGSNNDIDVGEGDTLMQDSDENSN